LYCKGSLETSFGDILFRLQLATELQPGAPAQVLHVDLYKKDTLNVFRFLVFHDDGAELAEHIEQVASVRRQQQALPLSSRARKRLAVAVPPRPVPKDVARPLGQPGMW
jgi:hypothetical protein